MKRIDRRKLIAAAAAVSAAVLLAVGATTAYFTDTETQKNVITIGRAKVSLTEPGYTEDSQVVVPGKTIAKDPVLTNTGTVDEFVFLKVEVPKGAVTLLESNGREKTGLSGNQQLFNIISESEDALSIASGAADDISFRYAPPWVLISAETVTADEKDTYVFGYSTRLAPKAATVPLFDKVQLKSFIDGEVSGDVEINVYGYAIQDRNLDVGTLADTLPEGKLAEIYAIVERKAVD